MRVSVKVSKARDYDLKKRTGQDFEVLEVHVLGVGIEFDP